MDNQDQDLLPRLETLARLYEACHRYGIAAPESFLGLVTESERHRRLFGHSLRFGCCKDAEEAKHRSDHSPRVASESPWSIE